MRPNAVQNYANKWYNCGEINEEQKKLMRPKAAQIGRAYGLPTIHKPFQLLRKLWSLIYTDYILSQHRKILNIIIKSLRTIWICC